MEYEIYHHGIKGMHWGIRRYQNKDGSLTAAGKKKYAKGQASTKTKSKPKSVKDMSNEELNARIKRAQLEKQYKDLHPKRVSAGEKFIKETFLPKAGKAVTDLVTDYLVKKARNYLGLTDDTATLKKTVERLNLEKQYKELTAEPDAVAKLKKTVERLNLEKQHKDLTGDTSLKDMKDEVTRLTLEKQLEKLREERKGK